MSDEAVYHDAPKTQEYGQTTAPTATVKVEPESEPETVEKKSSGFFGFLGKKKEEETKYEETPITKEEEKKYEETPISSSEYESEPRTQEYGQTAPAPITREYDQTAPITQEYDQATAPTATVKVEPESEPETVEKKSSGLFGFLGKKKEEENKYEETPISSSEYESEPKTQDYGQTTSTNETQEYGQTAPITHEYDQTTTKNHEYDQTTPITQEYDQTTPKTQEYDQTTDAPITQEYDQNTPTPITEEYDQITPKTHDYGQTTTAPITQEYSETTPSATLDVEPESETVEKEDRGMFDFMGKKKEEENKYEETTPISSSEYEQKVDLGSETEPKSEEQPETLFQKMHISHSGSTSDAEDADLTDQLKEKIEERKERKEEEETIKKLEDDNSVPIEKYEEEVAVAPPPYNTDVGTHAPTDVVHHDHLTSEPQEKKGLIEKIKEKLPGHKKPVVEEQVVPPSPTTVVEEEPEKRGIIGKIKDKIKGNHSKGTEEEKEKPKETY